MRRTRHATLVAVASILWVNTALAAPPAGPDHTPPPPMLAGPPAPMLKGPPPPMMRVPPPPAFPQYATSTFRLGSIRPARLTTDSVQYDGLIREVAERHGVEFALVKAVVKAESDFNRLAVSPKGARGLMQLMPQTAALHGVRDAFFPRDNLEGGCRHLRMLLERYHGNVTLALAAYNAGSERVEASGGVPPIAETREYLARVLSYRLSYMHAKSAGL